MLSLADAIEALKGTRPTWATQIITNATVDSRVVIPGSLFIALQGDKVDGHDYVEEAFSRGACYALAQREMPGEYLTLDLRGDVFPEVDQRCEEPVILLVDDCSQRAIISLFRKDFRYCSADSRIAARISALRVFLTAFGT